MIEKYRIRVAWIEVPTEEADPLVRASIERLVKNDEYETVQTFTWSEYLHRRLSEVATQMLTFTDPVSLQPITISAAGMAAGIKAFLTHWMLQNIPGTVINERGDVVKE